MIMLKHRIEKNKMKNKIFNNQTFLFGEILKSTESYSKK